MKKRDKEQHPVAAAAAELGPNAELIAAKWRRVVSQAKAIWPILTEIAALVQQVTELLRAVEPSSADQAAADQAAELDQGGELDQDKPTHRKGR